MIQKSGNSAKKLYKIPQEYISSYSNYVNSIALYLTPDKCERIVIFQWIISIFTSVTCIYLFLALCEKQSYLLW